MKVTKNEISKSHKKQVFDQAFEAVYHSAFSSGASAITLLMKKNKQNKLVRKYV